MVPKFTWNVVRCIPDYRIVGSWKPVPVFETEPGQSFTGISLVEGCGVCQGSWSIWAWYPLIAIAFLKSSLFVVVWLPVVVNLIIWFVRISEHKGASFVRCYTLKGCCCLEDKGYCPTCSLLSVVGWWLCCCVFVLVWKSTGCLALGDTGLWVPERLCVLPAPFLLLSWLWLTCNCNF